MDLLTRATVTEFADLACADPQWLREEFDALVAASFGLPPAAPPAVPPAAPRRRRHPPAGRGHGRLPAGRTRWFREHGHPQRSPPP
ncbi:MAG TPA: hypothetical protein VGG75_20310 [Trebonia sp.]|jgi:hypothetical protein